MKIIKEALQIGKSVSQVCIEYGYLNKDEIDKILKSENMLNPSIVK